MTLQEVETRKWELTTALEKSTNIGTRSKKRASEVEDVSKPAVTTNCMDREEYTPTLHLREVELIQIVNSQAEPSPMRKPTVARTEPTILMSIIEV